MTIKASAGSAASINLYFGSNSWIEGAALAQINQVAQMPGILAVAAMPDLCPGKYGPVGCAILSEMVHPLLVGSDIGCGMGLFQLDVSPRKLSPDKAAEKLSVLEPCRHAADDPDWMAEARTTLEQRGFRSTPFDAALGTIGGGNHFCELQAVEEIVNAEAAAQAGLDPSRVYALVHSGSRGLGHAILTELLAGDDDALVADSEAAQRYMTVHDEAVSWAEANRTLIAERAARALRSDLTCVIDQPHNFLEHQQGHFLHRKGAAPSDRGLVPVPGSRGTLSYLVRPLPMQPGALKSLAHGAGRKHDRQSMHGRAGVTRSERAGLERNPFGGRVVCSERDLLIEEAPQAYKAISQVIGDLADHGLAEVIATFRPLVTFKTARPAHDAKRADHRERRKARRHRERERR
ncbi:MAG: RNA ligase RtcB family protein [Pseudomonadota bacterium]